jgi:hypothetical protein
VVVVPPVNEPKSNDEVFPETDSANRVPSRETLAQVAVAVGARFILSLSDEVATRRVSPVPSVFIFQRPFWLVSAGVVFAIRNSIVELDTYLVVRTACV